MPPPQYSLWRGVWSFGTADMHRGVGVTFQRPCDVPPPPVAFVCLVPRVGVSFPEFTHSVA